MKRSDICETINGLKGKAGHEKVLEVYNSQKPLPRGYRMQEKDPWCAATVSAVLLINGYSDISECSCVVMVKKAKDLGIWIEDDAYVPKAGDIIMYDWQDTGAGDNAGTADHVGIVIDATDKAFVVREGNNSKTIKNRNVPIDSKYIRGFIVPPYEDDVTEGLEGDLRPVSISEYISSDEAPKAEEKPQSKPQEYSVGNTYTVRVKVGLNVRTGAGKSYPLVGYNNLTPDGKAHAIGSALRQGTRVTCEEVKQIDDANIWLRIPSGWICAKENGNKYVD